MNARFSVGIDLGTSHTVVAYADHAQVAQGQAVIHLLPITQAVGLGETASLPLLPSVRYHPAPDELGAAQASSARVQVDGVQAVLGQYAKQLGAQVPGRLVSSAKSWLSHTGVDRTAAILPWGAPEDVAKISPVDASASYLAHVKNAWDAQFPDAPLHAQEVVLTVPASFDEGARKLTLAAAQRAGLAHVRLLEEPQAAFHDWLFRHRQERHDQLLGIRRVLVCDVGGGTTDLTLIDVDASADPPQLTRVAVGDHLMLGGDNMDLALAHLLERRMGQSSPLSAARLAQLVQRCRQAKEQLLSEHAPEAVPVTLLGAGSKLVGSSVSATLHKAEVEQLVLDGFWPRCDANAAPHKRRAGIVEFGLPYPADPAITHHVAAFLQQHQAPHDEANTRLMPDAVLLNGGVFHSAAITQRLAHTLSDWIGQDIKVLDNPSPDAAVAQGAVAYALIRAQRLSDLKEGIGGGSPRTYALVLKDTPEQFEGICLLPRGTQEDTEVTLDDRLFALRLGQAVQFHLVSTVDDHPWQAGEYMHLQRERFVRLPAVTARLPLPAGQRPTDVTVRLSATMTEVGTLEVHCTHVDDPSQRWQLAFDLRASAQPSLSTNEHASGVSHAHPRLQEAVARIDNIFGTQAKEIDPKAVRQLRAQLEQILGARDQWPLDLLRALHDALWDRQKRRRRSAEHERVWLNLAGYCLRPGMGAVLDEWRIERLWPLFAQGIEYRQDANNWSEWWIFWRRASGGLNSDQQLTLLETVGEHLMNMQQSARAKNALHNSYDDMVRLAASLERVPAAYRVEVGNWLLKRALSGIDKPQIWWAVGRFGARISLYGNAENVVPPDVATQWLQSLLNTDWKHNEHAAFTAATLARMSGDRARDVSDEIRAQVIVKLQSVRAPSTWIKMVEEVQALDEADQKRSFGESLPIGLKLLPKSLKPSA